MTHLTTRWRQNNAPRAGLKERLRALLPRLGLALLTLLLASALLEGAARVLLPVPALIHFRDGIYLNTLPLVNGLRMDTGELPPQGTTLPEAKGTDELRIFVYGESSSVGGPWGYAAASATLLHDRLVAAWPTRKITVVNMGRSGSYTMDAWYYLLLSARFSPDVVIFYNGNNDRYDVDAEMCLPARHPALHGIWQGLVKRSWLLWNVRVLGPSRFGVGRTVGAGGPAREGCDPTLAFAGWAEALVGTAADLGAQVIVSLPVSSTAAELDLWEAGGSPGTPGKVKSEELSPEFKALLTCRLTADCDFDSALEQTLRLKLDAGFKTFEEQTLVHRIAGLKAAAARHGGVTVDLASALRHFSPRGILGPPLIFDEVHLSPEGYNILAQLWTQALKRMLEPPGAGQASSGAPASPDEANKALLAPAQDPLWLAYQPRLKGAHERRLVFEGMRYLEQWRPLQAASMLTQALNLYQNSQAALALGWMRLSLGLPSGLSPELEAQARALRPGLRPSSSSGARP